MLTGCSGWAGEHARRRGTFRPDRVVLAVARTLTSATRLLEALSVFDGDPRIEVIFTVDESSAFSGVRELLESDLPLTASENVEFDEADAPSSCCRTGSDSTNTCPTRRAPFRPGTSARLHGNSISLVTSHESMCEQLRAEYPEAAKHCVVVGDPSYDLMLASLRLRDRYRRGLDVEGRRPVVLSSTWRGGSVLLRVPGRCAAGCR